MLGDDGVWFYLKVQKYPVNKGYFRGGGGEYFTIPKSH